MEEWTSSEEEEEEGESDRKQTEAKVERKEEERKEKKERRKRRKMKKYNEEEEWEEDIQRLMASGIRNRLHTVELSRSEDMDPGWVCVMIQNPPLSDADLEFFGLIFSCSCLIPYVLAL
jgi:hypothetical protein